MALKLAKVLQRLEEHKYELEVWTLIENQLCPYLDMDEHRRAESGLEVVGCSETRVPMEVFERIIETIREDKIAPITEKIDEIENLVVDDSEEETDEEVPKRRKKVRKSTTKKGDPKSPSSKRLRSVTGRPR